MAETDQFSDTEILALTAVGESDNLGEDGMTQTLNVIMNRVAANKKWMGGDDARTVCLRKRQFDCWDAGSGDRQRIIDIGSNNPTYGPYLLALGLATRAIASDLADTTNRAVSYVDPPAKADVKPGSKPCAVIGTRQFYDLAAVE